MVIHFQVLRAAQARVQRAQHILAKEYTLHHASIPDMIEGVFLINAHGATCGEAWLPFS